MVKKIIYLVILIILSLCVVEKIRMAILDNAVFPIFDAISKDSTKYDMRVKCGQIKLYVRDYETAETILMEVIQQASTMTNKKEKYKAFYELGNVYYEMENYEDAVKAYELVLRENPTHRKALRKFARIKMAMRDYIPVYRYVNAYVKAKPDDAFGHTERCAVLTRLGKFSAARQSCEKALEIRKGYARAHYDFAVLLNAQGFKDLAKNELEEAIRHQPHIKSRNQIEKGMNITPKSGQPQPF